MGVVWKGILGRFGNHFECDPQEGLWFSSCVVPSRVGLRAGNTVGALVGFLASLRPNQNAYTEVKRSKVAEFRLHIFIIETLPRRFTVTFGSAVDLHSPLWTFGSSRGPSGDGITFGPCQPSASSGNLRVHLLTFGREGNLRAFSDLRTLRLPPCSFGQPPASETMIPNRSPSRARADSDGPNPRSLNRLQPKIVSLRRRLGRAEGDFFIRVDFLLGGVWYSSRFYH